MVYRVRHWWADQDCVELGRLHSASVGPAARVAIVCLLGPNVSAMFGPESVGTPAWAKMDPGSWAPSHFGPKARADETLWALMAELSRIQCPPGVQKSVL